MIVAIDPGKNIGIAFVSEKGELLNSKIVSAKQLSNYHIPENAIVVVGNGTTSSNIIKIVKQYKPILVDEKDTSLMAKELYFKDNPPSGWMRLIPKGLRSPNVLIDDYAAYAIALRYLGLLDDET